MLTSCAAPCRSVRLPGQGLRVSVAGLAQMRSASGVSGSAYRASTSCQRRRARTAPVPDWRFGDLVDATSATVTSSLVEDVELVGPVRYRVAGRGLPVNHDPVVLLSELVIGHPEFSGGVRRRCCQADPLTRGRGHYDAV
jgi:hypothetical protein